MQRRFGIEAQRPLRGIGSRNDIDLPGDFAHAVDMLRALVGRGKAEIGNVVPGCQIPKQMPGPKLAAGIEWQENVRLDP
jgi:hypothetical protein